MKHVILINEPECLRLQGDGTLAREVIDHKPFICPRCNGSGQVIAEDPHTGRLVKESCEVCQGSGELRATITIEWRPHTPQR